MILAVSVFDLGPPDCGGPDYGPLVYRDGYLLCRKGCGSKFKNAEPLDRHETVCSRDATDPLVRQCADPLAHPMLSVKPLSSLVNKRRGRPPRRGVVFTRPLSVRSGRSRHSNKTTSPRKIANIAPKGVNIAPKMAAQNLNSDSDIASE